MKITRVYEVWVGGDMIDDNLNLDEALATARHEFKQERKDHPKDPADVVIDEHAYITFEDEDEFDLVDFVPQWREMNDTTE